MSSITTTGIRVNTTKNYDLFKTLQGNRDVTEKRVNTIKQSIMEHGYIHNPIIVNEKMEVIDGQGRLEALKCLDLPVEFIMYPGLNVQDCIHLNVYQKPWKLTDYIDSYAVRGLEGYRYVQALLSEFPELPIGVIIYACNGKYGGYTGALIKGGKIKCTAEQYERAVNLLGYVMRFAKTIKMFTKGNSTVLCNAILFACQVPGCDRERLVDKFNKGYGMDKIPCFGDAKGAFRILSSLYNNRASQKIWFETEYEKVMSSKHSWHSKRYGTQEGN